MNNYTNVNVNARVAALTTVISLCKWIDDCIEKGPSGNKNEWIVLPEVIKATAELFSAAK